MLQSPIALHDIEDVQSFVANALHRTGVRFEPDEQEELIAEGICILYELDKTFEPQREGYAQAGRFSGYAAQFLPRRLGDAWHKRHPNHRRVTGEEGRRKWVYQEAPVSLDAVLVGQALNSSPNNLSGLSRGPGEETFRPQSQWAPVPVGTQPSLRADS